MNQFPPGVNPYRFKMEIITVAKNNPPQIPAEPMYNRIAIRNKIPFLIQNLRFIDFFELPILIRSEVRTGFTTNATNSDEDKTMIKVMGRYLKNSPIKLGQNMSGINAATVVAVDAIIAVATSPVPSFEA
jgi:hypothetical protein